MSDVYATASRAILQRWRDAHRRELDAEVDRIRAGRDGAAHHAHPVDETGGRSEPQQDLVPPGTMP